MSHQNTECLRTASPLQKVMQGRPLFPPSQVEP
uniref:Uncharacterized protein n=1 Tax=Anguilla anguilla TaxID=7936 RepID=A0A0E9W093_ANGAN